MALKFKCDNCGADIITKFLKLGEQAKCRSCGAVITVPSTAVDTDEDYDLKRLSAASRAELPKRGVLPLEELRILGSNEVLNNFVLDKVSVFNRVLGLIFTIGLSTLAFLSGGRIVGMLEGGNLGEILELGVVFYIVALVVIIIFLYSIFRRYRYRSLSRKRVQKLGAIGLPSTDQVLEKGVLLWKALRDRRASAEALSTAIQMDGGHPLLWNQAGIALYRLKRNEEAVKAFDRALAYDLDKKTEKAVDRNRDKAN